MNCRIMSIPSNRAPPLSDYFLQSNELLFPALDAAPHVSYDTFLVGEERGKRVESTARRAYRPERSRSRVCSIGSIVRLSISCRFCSDIPRRHLFGSFL